MTTLREKIFKIMDRYLDPEPKTDLIMQAIKSKYGWTDEDCPFSYGDEIEVETSDGFIDGETVWETASFLGYCKDKTHPYVADLNHHMFQHGNFKYARPVQKQEVTDKRKDMEDKLALALELGLELSVHGKKYKLVEVE